MKTQGLAKSVKLGKSNGQGCVGHPTQNKGETTASFISRHKEGSPFAAAVGRTTPELKRLKTTAIYLGPDSLS